MAAAGRSLTPFYIGLGVIAAVGAVLIATRVRGGSAPPLTLEPTGVPVAAGPRGVVLGSETAPVEIAEYSDFECPFCARFAVVQMPDVKQRLIETGRVRWRFVHFPLEGHLKSPHAHLAAACARRQGRFWEMHDLIYLNQDEWVASRRPEAVLARYAERLALDMAQYRQCMDGREAWGEVLADKALGDSLGVNATPTFFVNGRPAPARMSTYDQIRAVVDSLAPPAAAPPARR
jgi:protein-disulfide isomerase